MHLARNIGHNFLVVVRRLVRCLHFAVFAVSLAATSAHALALVGVQARRFLRRLPKCLVYAVLFFLCSAGSSHAQIASTVATEISVGETACAVVDGGLRCWGSNYHGGIGNPSSRQSWPVPVQVLPPGSGVTAVATGMLYSCALIDGGATCWGEDSTNGLRSFPMRVVIPAGTGVSALTVGYRHACAIVLGGVKCWGWNNYGQLGNGSLESSSVPVQAISAGAGVTAIAAGTEAFTTCAVVNGGVTCWGYGEQHLAGTTTGWHSGFNPEVAVTTPKQKIPSGSNVTAIAGNASAFCALASGGVQCWGVSAVGRLGVPLGVSTANFSASPVQTIPSGSDIIAIGVGAAHGCAASATNISCWGVYDYDRQFNFGDAWSELPQPLAGVPNGANISRFVTGNYSSCFLSNGSTYCFGQSRFGVIGDGAQISRLTPVPVIGLNGSSLPPQRILFEPPQSVPFVNYGTFVVSATGGPSDNPVIFSSATDYCIVAGDVVTMTYPGYCVLVANQAGNATFGDAVPVPATIIMGGASQTIIFNAVQDRSIDSGNFTIMATGGQSGNPVIFVSLTPDICTTSGVTGAVVALVAVGTCTLRATQAGNEVYNPATPIERSFKVHPIVALRLLNPLAGALETGAFGNIDETVARFSATAQRLSADGKSAVVVAVVSPVGTKPVTFSVSPTSIPLVQLTPYRPDFLVNPGSGAGAAFSVTINNPSSCGGDGCAYLALLWSPNGLPNNQTSPLDVTFSVAATQEGISITPESIRVQPPPVLLMHGIWSSANDAKFVPGTSGLNDYLRNSYPHYLIREVDYEYSSHRSFADIATQSRIHGAMRSLLLEAAQFGMVARQVDVVGHSMGGLATRYFMSHFPKPTLLPPQPLHRLVTIGTPHRGSRLADTLNQNRRTEFSAFTSLMIYTLCQYSSALVGIPCTLENVMAMLGKRLDTGLLSLVPNNPDLLAMEDPLAETTYDLRAIVGRAPSINGTESLLNVLVKAFLPGSSVSSLLASSEHDTIVSICSQINRFDPCDPPFVTQPPWVQVNDVVHTNIAGDKGETSSGGVWQQAHVQLTGVTGPTPVVSLALSSKAVPERAKVLAAPTNTVPNFDFSSYTQVDAGLVSFSPAPGSNVTVRTAFDLVASVSSKSISQVLLFRQVNGSSDQPIVHSNQSPFSIHLTPFELGTLRMVVFISFTDQTFAVRELSYTVQAGGTPSILTLSGVPVGTMTPGQAFTLRALANFPTGIVDVSSSASYSVRSGSAQVISGSGSNVVAVGAGSDWVDVVYGGLTSSVQLTVAPTPASAPNLISVASRKVHGAVGALDLSVATGVAIGGNVTVEPRMANNGHNVVFHFDSVVSSVAGVTATDAINTPVGAVTTSVSGNDVLVSLTGVSDGSRVRITVPQVNGAATAAVATIGFLVGNVTGSRGISSVDVRAVKARAGLTTTDAIARYDINASGQINVVDILTVKARSGFVLRP